jgi:peptidoglycan-associated lipoprotein
MSKKLLFVLLAIPFLATSCSHKEKNVSAKSEAKAASDLVKDALGLEETVYFAYDSSKLDAVAKKTLDEKVATVLKANKEAKVVIEGHCDERGTDQYNVVLGKSRADAVKKYLVNKGVKSSRIKTVSHGESRPVDSGHDEAAWAKNRRAVTISVAK